MIITAADVGTQNKTTYTGEDLAQVESFIENVSAAIEMYCKRSFSEPVPSVIKAIALLEVRRLLNSEPGVANERLAELSTTYEFTALLSNSSKADLKAYLRWTSPRVGVIRLYSPSYAGSCLPVPDVQAEVSGTDVIVSGRTVNEGLVQIQYTDNGFEWDDVTYTPSGDISDGDLPYFRGILAAPAAGSYKFRARWRYDEETSRWSKATSLEVA